MGGGGVSVPPPSAEERELQRQQAETLKLQREILEQQRMQSKVLIPFLAEQEGFDVTTDEFGNITAIGKKPKTELDLMKDEIEKAFTERSLKALKGELPVDPALEETLKVQEQELRNKLSTQLGPGYETSTPGIETLGNFFRSAEILREGARTNQLTLAEQLGITREQQRQFREQSATDLLTQQGQQVPLTLAGAFGQNAAGFGRAQEPFIRHREMQLQASIANSQSRASMFGAGVGALGSIIGVLSDERLKLDIEIIGWQRNLGVPIYQFRFTDDPEDMRRFGLMAQDVLKVRPDLVYRDEQGNLMIDYGSV
jgi:hypothetical protein